MTVINRYSQIPAPLQVVVPTMEEIAQNGLAKAQADVSSYATANAFDTAYSIMSEQEDYAKGITADFEKNLEGVTEDILNNRASNNTARLYDLSKKYNEVYGENSELHKMQLAKTQRDLYNKQLQSRIDIIGADKVSGLSKQAQDAYMNKWQSGDRGAAYEGNLGVKDSQYYAKAQQATQMALANPKVTEAAWEKMDPENRTVVTLEDGSKVYYQGKGSSRTEVVPAQVIEDVVKTALINDPTVKADLEERYDLGLSELNAEETINATAKQMGEEFQRNNVSTTSGYTRIGQSAAPQRSAPGGGNIIGSSNIRTGSPSISDIKGEREPIINKLTVEERSRVTAQQNKVDNLSAIKDEYAKNGYSEKLVNMVKGSDNPEILSAMQYSTAKGDDKVFINAIDKNISDNTSGLLSDPDYLAVNEKFNKDPEVQKINKELEKLGYSDNAIELQRKEPIDQSPSYGSIFDFSTALSPSNQVAKGSSKTEAANKDKAQILLEQRNNIWANKVNDYAKDKGRDKWTTFEADPTQKKAYDNTSAITNNIATNILSNTGNYRKQYENNPYTIKDSEGNDLSEEDIANIDKTNLKSNPRIEIDAEDGEIKMFATSGTGKEAKQVEILIDVNKLNEKDRVNILNDLDRGYGTDSAESNALDNLIEKNKAKTVLTGAGADSSKTAEYSGKTPINIDGQEVQYGTVKNNNDEYEFVIESNGVNIAPAMNFIDQAVGDTFVEASPGQFIPMSVYLQQYGTPDMDTLVNSQGYPLNEYEQAEANAVLSNYDPKSKKIDAVKIQEQLKESDSIDNFKVISHSTGLPERDDNYSTKANSVLKNINNIKF